MNNPFDRDAPGFDAQAIQATIQRALTAAGLDASTGPLLGVTQTIRRALAAGGLGGVAPTAGRAAPFERSALPTLGTFAQRTFSNRAGTRAYKLYVPARAGDAPLPVVVMLHGCTQSADDFAVGTRMNRLADEHGFLVVYPEQAAQANASKCWNWFSPGDQGREAGEPALIAGIVHQVVAEHGADPRRVFVAGLSAGAAMAVVMGETYPELFAGVGAHSGLPYGSAHDVTSALAAMKGRHRHRPAAPGPTRAAVRPVPTIVFHGDRDHTVQASNGADIVQQALQAHAARVDLAPLKASMQRGESPGGRSYSRSVHADEAGQVHIERWTLHGAGHAWSGGDARGSFTDASGPDASAEMVRFFLGLRPVGSA